MKCIFIPGYIVINNILSMTYSVGDRHAKGIMIIEMYNEVGKHLPTVNSDKWNEIVY